MRRVIDQLNYGMPLFNLLTAALVWRFARARYERRGRAT